MTHTEHATNVNPEETPLSDINYHLVHCEALRLVDGNCPGQLQGKLQV